MSLPFKSNLEVAPEILVSEPSMISNEISSLSERFGINLLFQKPTNDEFIKIVLELAHDNNINIEDKILIEKAQRMALIKGSKSPRIARQLIDNLLANILI